MLCLCSNVCATKLSLKTHFELAHNMKIATASLDLMENMKIERSALPAMENCKSEWLIPQSIMESPHSRSMVKQRRFLSTQKKVGKRTSTNKLSKLTPREATFKCSSLSNHVFLFIC